MRGVLIVLAIGATSACATLGSGEDGEAEPQEINVDAAPLLDEDGAPSIDLGTEERPATSCDELRVAVGPVSGRYWVRPGGEGAAFEVYCEQELNGGGWALLYNSVKTDGVTTGFWAFGYAERLARMGTPALDHNFYHGDLYILGRHYMDVITDLQGTTAVAAEVTVDGFDHTTMKFQAPVLIEGVAGVFNSHFNGGWAAADHDGDTNDTLNCAAKYGQVAQHYGKCWSYNLGADADMPYLDGGVGPHAHNNTVTALGLTPQADGGTYSRLQRISRFVRW